MNKPNTKPDQRLARENRTSVPDGVGVPVDRNSHIYLIDGSAYIFRAYFAMFKASQARGKNISRSDGTPTGAVMTFCSMLFKIVREGLNKDDPGDDPTHIGVIFDHKGDTFRNKLFPDYKANREAPPEDLIPQFPLIRDAVRAFGFTPIEQEGFEADDLIATYARQAQKVGASVTIISGDKDLMQLVGEGVCMFDPMPGNERRIELGEVQKKFGVSPDKVVDVQALAGDSTDNVPGVPGIGIKTAAQLIHEFGDLDTLLEQAHTIKQKKRRENLIEFADQARLSRQLVFLDPEVPLKVGLDELDIPEIEPAKLIAFSKAMEFRTFTKRIADAFGFDADAIEADPNLAAAQPAHDSKEASTGSTAETDGFSPQAVIEHNRELATAPAIDRTAYETISTIDALHAWLAEAREVGYFAFDTETTGLDAMRADLVGFSLATKPGRACYVPLAHSAAGDSLDFDGGNGEEQIPIREALDAIKPLLEDRAVLKIGQNLKYDILILKRYGIELTPIDDTMLISYALDGGRGGHGMDDLAQRHLGHSCIPFKQVIAYAPGKKVADKTFAGVPIDKATEYAAEDADVTLRLWMVLKPRLIAERMTTVYETLERPLVPIIVNMEHAGISVDRTILSRLSATFAQRAAELEDKVRELAGGEKFNLASPKQLGELLFDKLQLPGGKKTKTGQWETRATLLDDLAGNEELPEDARQLVHTMLEWRQLTKLRSTYTDALPTHINPDTQRIHTSYALASTTTGRLASTDPNLQNIPIRTKEGREIRTAFVAEKGNKLLSADYSQIELRVLAHIADIPQLRQAFDDGLDIHAMTASEMFGVPIKDMPSEVRRRAKAINFGIIYGISAFGLANQLSIPREEAAAYIKTYFERFPGIKDYMEATKSSAKANGYVETIFGRKVHYPEINTKNPSARGFYERAAINAPIQGSAADIIRRAMIRIPKAIGDAGLRTTRMLLQVHDELIFEVSEAEVDTTLKVVSDVMEKSPEPVLKLSVPLKVDAQAADDWEAAH